jgi:cell division protease FtsH
LIRYETIDAEQIDDIMAGKEPRPPKDWNSGTPSRPDGSAPAPAASPARGGSIGGPAQET